MNQAREGECLFKNTISNQLLTDRYRHFKRILIIQTAFLGDVILTTPLIRAVHQLFPGAHIDALILPQNAPVLKNNPYLDGTINFDKRSNKFLSFFGTLAVIRKKKYNLAVSPHSSMTSALLMLLGGIKERLGFDRRFASNLLTLKVPHLSGIHKIEKNLHLLHVFTDTPFDSHTELFPDKEKVDFFNKKLCNWIKGSSPIIALAPGSVWFTKRWPWEKYLELTRLLANAGYNLIFIGAPNERDLCSKIITGAGITALNFAGETSPLDSAALLIHCDILICNDCGAMHIANAVNTDVIAFFGPTVTSIGYYPYRKNDIVLEVDMQCRPCGSHGGRNCPLGHHRCMNEISVKTVFEAVNITFNSHNVNT